MSAISLMPSTRRLRFRDRPTLCLRLTMCSAALVRRPRQWSVPERLPVRRLRSRRGPPLLRRPKDSACLVPPAGWSAEYSGFLAAASAKHIVFALQLAQGCTYFISRSDQYRGCFLRSSLLPVSQKRHQSIRHTFTNHVAHLRVFMAKPKLEDCFRLSSDFDPARDLLHQFLLTHAVDLKVLILLQNPLQEVRRFDNRSDR